MTFEIKFDGYRCIAVKRGSEVTLFSCKQKALDKRFQKMVDAIAELENIVRNAKSREKRLLRILRR